MTRAKFIPLQAAVQANAFALAACAGSSDDQSAGSAGSADSASGVEGPDGVPPLSQVQGPDFPWLNWKTSPARCSCCRTSV